MANLEHLMKRDDWSRWHDLQNSLMQRLNSARTQFIKQFEIWVKWHIKLVGEQNNVAYNEYYETQAGILVQGRTLVKAPAQ